jgi:hypothetical protein
MGEFISYLNANAGALNLLFTGVVAVATVVYAILTSKLVKETRDLREAQTEPRIEVFFRPRDEWMALLDIVVKNIGAGPAYDLRFSIQPLARDETSEHLLQRLNGINSIRTGIAYLGPGQEFSSYWTNVKENFEKKIEVRFHAESSFNSATGRSYRREHNLDLSELKGLEKIGEPPLLKIGKALEKIQDDFHRLAGGARRLRVDVYTANDRTAEEAYWDEQRAKSSEQGKSE